MPYARRMLTGQRYRVATVRNIPIYVGTTWLWIAALYLYLQYLRLSQSFVGPSDAEALALAAVSFVLFFGGVLFHEASHAVVARAFDLPVAGITLVFWGGATETRANAKGPLAEFLVSAAGPASTLALAGVFHLIANQLEPGLLRAIVRDLAWLNLLFAGLNALPGFPLDGGRMLLAATWGLSRSRRTALRVAGAGGVLIGGLFIAYGVMGIREGNIARTIFLGYLGVILITTGRGTFQQVALRQQLASGSVGEAMRPPPQAIDASMTLSEALDRYLRDDGDRAFPVVDGRRLIGTISMRSARRVGGRDPLRPVRDAVEPLNLTAIVSPDEPLDEVLDWVGGRDGLVVRGDELVGGIAITDVERWYRRHYETGVPDEGDAVLPARPDL
jgi:Zn-dependent protease